MAVANSAARAKRQRLTLALLALGAVVAAALLAMSALAGRASYFYSPTDVLRRGVEPGQSFRLGGMVETGSLRRAGDGLTLDFVVRDESHQLPVRFRGIAPDLFREGSGVVAEGSLERGVFVATQLLAKHDENYRPPTQAGVEHRTISLVR